jgi:hypothetical protein
MEKKEQQTKTLSELYILCVEDTIHDIKQRMKEWYYFSVEEIEYYLTLPMTDICVESGVGGKKLKWGRGYWLK